MFPKSTERVAAFVFFIGFVTIMCAIGVVLVKIAQHLGFFGGP